MRILQVNKFHYNRGGADKYYLSLIKNLEQDGHQVAAFSMYHPKNSASLYAKYFVSRLSFNEGGLIDILKTPGRMIYSLEAKRKFKNLVKDFKPEIIHIHNIYHQISPSILDIAAKFKIPVVMHLHDYKLICPNYQLFVGGETCEACKPHKYFNCYRKQCFKGSKSKSMLATLEMFIHHRLLKIYEKNIHTFIAPSDFMKQKLVEFGWNINKIKLVINPFDAEM
jgi:glycosyltransferase involved in cell wall biosynthesis